MGVDAATITRIAREFAAADKALVYGRIGTCTVSFGTTASWLVDVVNTITGNLDREGGVMFTNACCRRANNAWRKREQAKASQLVADYSRVRKFPEALGEYPVSVLAEEIATPGEGQIKALITAGGNPVLSTPNTLALEESNEVA